MSSAGGGKGDDSEVTLVLIFGLAFVLGWILWAMAKQPIVEGIRWVKWAELSVFQLVDPSLAQDRKLLEDLKNDQATIRDMNQQASKAKREISPREFYERGLLAPPILWGASNHIGSYTRWPIAFVLFGFAIFYMFFSKKTKFRTAYNLESLMRLQAQHWPVITPVIDFDPAQHNARRPGEEVPHSLPPFSEALSPEEWVVFNQVPFVNKAPEKEALRRAFLPQLGPRWTGLSCLTTAQRCLFAAFALKGAQRRRESDVLLGKIALMWNIKTDFTPTAELMAEVNKYINDPKIGGEALKVADHFAFRTTALLGVLKWARMRGGVLAPATFVWLRAHDRALWYPLNNLGRRSYHAEASGVMAHFMAELAAGRPLPIPRVETAVMALLQYWSDPEKHLATKGVPVVPTRAPTKGKKGWI